jgi:hypothetical protein
LKTKEIYLRLLNKWIKKFKNSKEPEYLIPDYECSPRILLCGPTYGDITFFGSFILEANAIKQWALEHSKNVYSTNKMNQQARQYLPTWLDSVKKESSNHITLLDSTMRDVLVPYTFDFYTQGSLKIYCHQCSQEYDSLIDNEHDSHKYGNKSTWTDEWLCPKGHILHHKTHEVRWIVRKKLSIEN